MYFIPLMQSSANAVCFYLQLFLNLTSLPLLLCHFGLSRTPFPLNSFPLIASYLSPWALLLLFPPYSLVSAQQSSEVFKGPVRSRHLSPQNKIQSPYKYNLLDLFAGYFSNLVSYHSCPGSPCSICTSLPAMPQMYHKYTLFSGPLHLRFPRPRTLFQVSAPVLS